MPTENRSYGNGTKGTYTMSKRFSFDIRPDVIFLEKLPPSIHTLLKVTMHLQTDHFFEILIFRLMYRSTHELSYKKKILKNIK